MNQIILIFSLFAFGLLFGLLFKKHIPVELICSTAFLWGSLYWVISALFMLNFSIPYTLPNILISFSFALVLILNFFIRKQLWKLNKKETLWVLASLLVFTLILFATSTWNFSAGTLDSMTKILAGKSLAYDGITPLNQAIFGSIGSFAPIMQSISVLIKVDYMYLVSPAFAFSLFLTFLLLSRQILQPVTKSWLPISLLTLGMFTTTYFIRFQIFYIHDSLIAGTYLLTSLAGFWLSIKEKKPFWLVFSTLSLLGFSLARVENPVFAIFFLAIVLSTQKIPKKHQLRAFIPFLSVNILWYIRILMTLDADGRFLKTSNTLITIGALCSFGLYIYLSSKINWIEKKITSKIYPLMMLSLMLAVLFFIIRQPLHTFTNISNITRNFYVHGLWGASSILVTFLLVFLPLPNLNNIEDRVFSASIIVFITLTVLVGGLRGTYRLGWSDSANRMMVHIMPTVFLYLIVKYRNLSESSQLQIDELTQTRRFQATIIGTFLLVIMLIPLIGLNLLYN